jgi:hypothetical protein
MTGCQNLTYQACPYCASNGEHLKVTRLQTSLQRRRGSFFNIGVFRSPGSFRQRFIFVVGRARPSLRPVLHSRSIDASSGQIIKSAMQQGLRRSTWPRWKTTKMTSGIQQEQNVESARPFDKAVGNDPVTRSSQGLRR